uniref:BTB domain-containing protein n=1 Tax=Panagrolaimus sp. ES5 TaxID=591445 RepID=A0AC34F7W7_9BILA
MFRKVDYVQKAELSSNSTTITFGENLGFDLVFKLGLVGQSYYRIENIKGDFEITKITLTDGAKEDDVYFCKTNMIFSYAIVGTGIYTFYITAKIETKEICIKQECIFVCETRLRLLKLHQYLRSAIFLYTNDGRLKLPYYVTKLKENDSTGNNIEIHIENPYDIEIEGKKGDYKIEVNGAETIALELTFLFDPSINVKSETESSSNIQQNESIEIAAYDESRLEFIPSEIKTSKLYKIMSNEKFADIFLILPDKTKIPSHRCILYESSTVFAKIIDETSELPISINIEEDFDAETIQAALEFLFDKFDSINKKEMDVFKFAIKYGIQDLMDACCSFFEKSVDPSNVCEYIQIGYANDFEELKQKCLKIMVVKKKEIDAAKLSNLPKNILLDFFNALF